MPRAFLYQLNASMSQPLNVVFNDCFLRYFSNSSVNFEVIDVESLAKSVVIDIGSLLNSLSRTL